MNEEDERNILYRWKIYRFFTWQWDIILKDYVTMSLRPHSKQKMNDVPIHRTKNFNSSCEPMQVLGVMVMVGGEHGYRYMPRRHRH